MRAKVVPMRDIHEKFRAEVKPFLPAFVVARRYPGWDAEEPAAPRRQAFPAIPSGGKAPRFIEVKPRA